MKYYKGKNTQNIDFIGFASNDYYNEEMIPLLEKLINLLPKNVDIVDNGELIAIILEDNLIQINKEFFDLEKSEMILPWDCFWEEMFNKSENMNAGLFASPANILEQILKYLPNYQFAVLKGFLNDFYKNNLFAKKYISDKLFKIKDDYKEVLTKHDRLGLVRKHDFLNDFDFNIDLNYSFSTWPEEIFTINNLFYLFDNTNIFDKFDFSIIFNDDLQIFKCALDSESPKFEFKTKNKEQFDFIFNVFKEIVDYYFSKETLNKAFSEENQNLKDLEFELEISLENGEIDLSLYSKHWYEKNYSPTRFIFLDFIFNNRLDIAYKNSTISKTLV